MEGNGQGEVGTPGHNRGGDVWGPGKKKQAHTGSTVCVTPTAKKKWENSEGKTSSHLQRKKTNQVKSPPPVGIRVVLVFGPKL